MFLHMSRRDPRQPGRARGFVAPVSLVIIIALFYSLCWPAAPTRGQEPATIPLTFRLSQSTDAYQFWTTPPSERVFKDDAIPSESGAEVPVFAAKNEFEPFQVVVQPTTSGNVTVEIGEFGAGITAEIYQVDYVPITEATDSLGRTGDYPDPLWPLENGASVPVVAGENTAFWFSLAVPRTTPQGDYTTNVTIGGVSIPVRLHVFGFALPDERHVKSQMNVSHQAILEKYGVSGTGDDYWQYVRNFKRFFFNHRLTPKSPLWPGGVTGGRAAPFIDYDCETHTLTDNDGIWGFEILAEQYLDGTLFQEESQHALSPPIPASVRPQQQTTLFLYLPIIIRSGPDVEPSEPTGFPSFMAATFGNNDSSQDQRPGTLCGQTRSEADWYTAANPNTPYNQAWFTYMGALQEYLRTTGYLDKAYYYFANEPQDQADYDAVAWYSQELKKAAPDFKLMVSEEPKPEIYNHATHTGAKIDIWLPVLNQYNPDVSHERARNHGEETWIYFLHGTRPPFFNPITLDHPGIESKFTGWFLWKYRVRGIAYYALNSWGKNPWTDPMNLNHNGDLFMLYPPSKTNEPIEYGANNHRFVPSIRFELMRDSLEDYEYLYVLSGNSQPIVDQTNAGDPLADKIISSVTSYTRDSEFLYNLRRLIGLKNGGEIDTIPDIQPETRHPRAEGPPGNYYINFQDPAGEPLADPLIVGGKTYMKIGWNDYDEDLGYGWYSPNEAHWMARYLSSGPNELQRSIIYSDWGRPATFEFDLPSGTYNVTVSVGWQDKSYAHNFIEVEGINFFNDEKADPYLVRTKEVTISDYTLTMNMGLFDTYTMLNYIDIEAAGP